MYLCLRGFILGFETFVWLISKQNIDKLIVGFTGDTLGEKILVGKTLMNHWLFIKNCQTFVLYSS